MRNFKGIIMSEYTSKLITLRHFLKIFSMIHIDGNASKSCISKMHNVQEHKKCFK